MPQELGFEGIIVMAHYTQGSLLNYLRNFSLSWKQMIRLAYCITNGLAYLHKETNKGCYNMQMKIPTLNKELNLAGT